MIEINGILINYTKYKNNDLICSILTEKGMINFINRGALKKNSKINCSLYKMQYGKYDLYKGNQKYYSVRSFFPITVIDFTKVSFEILAIYDFISELIYKTFYENTNCELFYKELLKIIEKTYLKYEFLWQTLYFFCLILKFNGVFPEIKTNNIRFSFSKNEFIEEGNNDSSDEIILNKHIVNLLHSLIKNKEILISKEQFKELFNYFCLIIEFHFNIKLNSHNLVLKI